MMSTFVMSTFVAPLPRAPVAVTGRTPQAPVTLPAAAGSVDMARGVGRHTPATVAAGPAPAVSNIDLAIAAGKTTALAAVSSSRVRRRAARGVRRARARVQVLAKGGGSTTSAEVDVETEIAELKRAAAELRATAQEFEVEQVQQRALKNQQYFKTFDIDGSGRLDAAKLRVGMKEVKGLEVDEDKAARLVRLFDSDGNGTLEVNEFDVSALWPALERLSEEDRAREEAARAQERELQAQLEKEREIEEYRTTLPGKNQDVGLITRMLCVFAYVLPLVDALRFGMPVAVLFPITMPFFLPFLWINMLFQSIPFGQVILFFGMQFLSANAELPALLRFNLRQAIQLDIAILFPTLFSLFVFRGEMFEEAANAVGSWVFLPGVLLFFALTACVIYSVATTLGGEAPRSIPLISAQTEKALGMVPPGSSDDRS